MFRLLDKFLFLTLLVFPSTLLLCGNVAFAQEDETEDEPETAQATADDTEAPSEEEDSKSDEEEQPTKESTDTPDDSSQKEAVKGDGDEEEKEDQLKSSPDADSIILFKKKDQQFIAGITSKCLVSFSNNGRNDFHIDMMEASLRYPQDYSYYIQNFTAFQYNTLVKPGEQANFEYAFQPHESFGGRPFGLSINLLYKDTDGKHYRDAVFNETVQLGENDDGMDGETFFMYLFVVAVGALLVMGAYYGLTSIKSVKSTFKPTVERGTVQDEDIDYEWLPKETTTEFVKNSPRRSPRNRRQKRNTGSDE